MDQVESHIRELRKVIRYHRDQIGDDRCWVDDHLVWNALPETKQVLRLPTYDEGMRQCRAFFNYRNSAAKEETPAGAILDSDKWDDDLLTMSSEGLNLEFNKLESAIKRHYHITDRERTLEDDKELYSALPENIPAYFRLPSEEDFLGTTRTDAGCPQFWRSHENCPGEHNMHQWGPCKKS